MSTNLEKSTIFISECFIHISFCFMLEASILSGTQGPNTYTISVTSLSKFNVQKDI
jgi:hypothetical protein